MKRCKTAKFFPNAILIESKNGQVFLTSFGSRDKTFLLMHRLWQCAVERNVGIAIYYELRKVNKFLFEGNVHARDESLDAILLPRSELRRWFQSYESAESKAIPQENSKSIETSSPAFL